MRTTCHHQSASSCSCLRSRSQSSLFLTSRRNVLFVPLGSLTLAGAVLFRPGWSRARAEEVSAPVQVQENLLPREYKRSTQELLETLKRTIELEKSGASEFEVRIAYAYSCMHRRTARGTFPLDRATSDSLHGRTPRRCADGVELERCDGGASV